MNLRNLSITVAILVVLCGIAWFLRRPETPASADPRIGLPVLDAGVAAQATRVRIADAGKTIELARGSDGSWTVPSYHDFPADFSKLSRFVNDLTGAKIQRLVTSRPDRLGRLEFKDASISLGDSAGKDLWQVALGKNAEGGGRFLRYGDEGKGYLANISLWLDTEPKNWADAVILALKSDELARIEIGFAGGADTPVVVARAKKDDAWSAESAPEGQRLKPDRITSLVSAFSGLRFTDTAAPDDERVVAARAHSRTIKFTDFAGNSWTVTLGRKPEEKRPKTTDRGTTDNGTAVNPAGPALEPGRADATSAAADAPKESKDTATGQAAEPAFETIPAGPVFVHIASSDAGARINALMERRAFQISEWTFTSLPQSAADLFESPPAEPQAVASP